MTSNRTIKAAVGHAFVVALALAGTAWAGCAFADDATRIAGVAKTEPAKAVTSGGADQSFDLTSYGDRFKRVIGLIEKNTSKPCWSWGDTGEDNADEVAVIN